MTHFYPPSESYRITLLSRHHFHTLAEDYRIIYGNFCLLSYMTDICRITITNKFTHPSQKHITVFKFTFDQVSKQVQETHYLFLTRKQEFNAEAEQLTIEYQVGKEVENVPSNTSIVVSFTKTEGEQPTQVEYINIEIKDPSHWIHSHFSNNQQSIKSGRLSRMSTLKPDELEYFYQEPKEIRTKNIEGKHISLALQGGGVKGIAYLGACAALKEHYGEDVPLRSVMGSSVGGILGLGITCELPTTEL